MISENRFSDILLIGLYYGLEKPVDVNLYLKDFVNEWINLTSNGIFFNSKRFEINFKMLICDTQRNHLFYVPKCIQDISLVINVV